MTYKPTLTADENITLLKQCVAHSCELTSVQRFSGVRQVFTGKAGGGNLLQATP